MFDNPPVEPLVEGSDYVMEGGLLVFTREYLLTRPCCGNGCRNCPYGVNPGSTEPVDKEFA
jgi:Family of unknown function (DUF5522)